MVPISNDIKVKVGIAQGQVYNFSPKQGVLNHYYVVLNKNPKSSEEIYLAPFTSQKDNVLKFIKMNGFDERTYVEIKSGECNFLPNKSQSGIDCNRLIYIDIEELISRIDSSDGGCNYPVLNPKIFIKIKEGVALSPLVKPVVVENM